MITRYSICHFAIVMKIEGDYTGILRIEKCSFCGKECYLVPMPFIVHHDVELTLRRWKDGDCTLDEMFDRLNTEYRRAWNEVFEVAQRQLQENKESKFVYYPEQMTWRLSKPKGTK